MKLRDFFHQNGNAAYWVGQAKAWRTASEWNTLPPRTVESFRFMMRNAALYAVQDAKYAMQRAKTEARIAAAFGGAK